MGNSYDQNFRRKRSIILEESFNVECLPLLDCILQTNRNDNDLNKLEIFIIFMFINSITFLAIIQLFQPTYFQIFYEHRILFSPPHYSMGFLQYRDPGDYATFLCIIYRTYLSIYNLLASFLPQQSIFLFHIFELIE